MGRHKLLIGPRLRFRGFAAQQTEAAIGVVVLNRMLATGRPDSVRRQPVSAPAKCNIATRSSSPGHGWVRFSLRQLAAESKRFGER
jgi:hypothetical protein